MYTYNEKRIIISVRRSQLILLEKNLNDFFKKEGGSQLVGKMISDIYIENKSNKIRVLLCRFFARMNSDELKYLIYYLRYIHYEKSIDFTAAERLLIARLILRGVDDNGGDFIICRNTLRDSISSKTSPLEVFSEGFRPH